MSSSNRQIGNNSAVKIDLIKNVHTAHHFIQMLLKTFVSPYILVEKYNII